MLFNNKTTLTDNSYKVSTGKFHVKKHKQTDVLINTVFKHFSLEYLLLPAFLILLNSFQVNINYLQNTTNGQKIFVFQLISKTSVWLTFLYFFSYIHEKNPKKRNKMQHVAEIFITLNLIFSFIWIAQILPQNTIILIQKLLQPVTYNLTILANIQKKTMVEIIDKSNKINKTVNSWVQFATQHLNLFGIMPKLDDAITDATTSRVNPFCAEKLWLNNLLFALDDNAIDPISVFLFIISKYSIIAFFLFFICLRLFKEINKTQDIKKQYTLLDLFAILIIASFGIMKFLFPNFAETLEIIGNILPKDLIDCGQSIMAVLHLNSPLIIKTLSFVNTITTLSSSGIFNIVLTVVLYISIFKNLQIKNKSQNLTIKILLILLISLTIVPETYDEKNNKNIDINFFMPEIKNLNPDQPLSSWVLPSRSIGKLSGYIALSFFSCGSDILPTNILIVHAVQSKIFELIGILLNENVNKMSPELFYQALEFIFSILAFALLECYIQKRLFKFQINEKIKKPIAFLYLIQSLLILNVIGYHFGGGFYNNE